MPVTRTLLATDLPHLRALLLRLGHEDRILRFGRVESDSDIGAHCARIAQAGQAVRVLGAFEGVKLIGAAEDWFDAGPPPLGCEVSVEVDAPWRGRGVGTGLLGRAVLVARNRWTRRLHLACHVENRSMQRLARRVAGELRFSGGGAEAEVLLPHSSWHSFWAEAVMDARGFATVSAPRVRL